MHADFGEIERAVAALEHDIARAFAHCHRHRDQRPVSITLTVK